MQRLLNRFTTTALAFFTLTMPLVALAQDDAPKPPSVDHWKGAVVLPGDELGLHVKFVHKTDAPGDWDAFLDIPVQGITGAKMAEVVYTKEKLTFTFAQVRAVFEADIAQDGQSATGSLNQNGMTFTLNLTRQTADQAGADKPKRPQMPQPPFPYEARDVEYKNETDNITIAGTLTIPNGPGRFPAVLLITGSGPQDRDETLMGHKPFWVIADHLTRNGVAVLRCDDRGIGGTSGNITTSTAEDFAHDVLAGVEYLKTVDKINSTRIGLMGHSEGGIIAPLVASQSREVAFIILLAGTGLPGEDILRMQTRLLLNTAGIFSEEQLDAMEEKHRALTQSVINEAPVEQQRTAVLELLRAQGVQGTDEELAGAVNGQLMQMKSPWFRAFLTHDPRPALRQVTCPVLALNGSLDLQVPPDENLAEIRKALSQAGNTDVTTNKLLNLNHLFQHATNGSVTEYARIEETFAPEALDIITQWILKRFPSPAAADAEGVESIAQ